MSQLEEAKSALEGILLRMGFGGTVAATEDDERITLEISGVEAGIAVGRQGTTLDALQFVVNKMVSRGGEPGAGDNKPIAVDTEGYRARRAESLQELALQLAEKARTTGKPQPVHPMSAGDRRVMHLALAEVKGVTTRSEGEGADRRLIVIPDVTPSGSQG